MPTKRGQPLLRSPLRGRGCGAEHIINVTSFHNKGHVGKTHMCIYTPDIGHVLWDKGTIQASRPLSLFFSTTIKKVEEYGLLSDCRGIAVLTFPNASGYCAGGAGKCTHSISIAS